MFGEWLRHVDVFRSQFETGNPYPNVVIPNFLEPQFAETLALEFPTPDASWIKYWNPIEKKYAKNQLDDIPEFRKVIEAMQTPEFVAKISEITGISKLEADPYLHGAGLHSMPRGGKLDMHLDYSIHPISKKERRINIIIYLNKVWDPEYGGHLELWDAEFTGAKARILPGFNTAILFQTSDISYHGIPSPIQCPENQERKSIAIFYVADRRPDAIIRHKAEFRALPWQPVTPPLQALYDIRRSRNITEDVLREVYPEWETDGNGYW